MFRAKYSETSIIRKSEEKQKECLYLGAHAADSKTKI